MNTLTITWKAFEDIRGVHTTTSTTIELPSSISVYTLLYKLENEYEDVWEFLEPVLPPNRTHTVLAFGDEVTINEETFRYDKIGWTEINKENQ
jgi:hypothetical protein